ncbi:MAG: hypothetical protein FWC91_13295, partial [Defluviitaleaceae bacterium]|nr:hypothetical protein [Defluviitaleaceae bacterium]
MLKKWKFGLLVFILAFIMAGCDEYGNIIIRENVSDAEQLAIHELRTEQRALETTLHEAQRTLEEEQQQNTILYDDGITSIIFVQDTNGLDDGVLRLLSSMDANGQPFYQSNDIPHGMIASDDVVLLQINVQWAERGGTNTDLIA